MFVFLYRTATFELIADRTFQSFEPARTELCQSVEPPKESASKKTYRSCARFSHLIHLNFWIPAFAGMTSTNNWLLLTAIDITQYPIRKSLEFRVYTTSYLVGVCGPRDGNRIGLLAGGRTGG